MPTASALRDIARPRCSNTEDAERTAESQAFLYRQPGSIIDANLDLFAYYHNVVCPIMVPTLDARLNPWLCLYVPMAGSSGSRQWRLTQCQLALRQGVMAVAACHVSQKGADARRIYLPRARELRDTAHSTIQDTLGGDAAGLPPGDKLALLAAAMTLITTDVFTAEPTDSSVFLDTAKRIIPATGGGVFWQSSHVSNILLQMLRCYDLIAATTRREWSDFLEVPGSLERPGWPLQDSHEGGGGQDAGYPESSSSSSGGSSEGSATTYILDSSFGLGRATMNLLRKTITLGAALAKGSRGAAWPDTLVSETVSLYHRLLLVAGDSTAFDIQCQGIPPYEDATTMSGEAPDASEDTVARGSYPKAVNEEIIRNYQRACHYGVIIYFHRVVPSSFFTAHRSKLCSAAVVSSLAGHDDCQVLAGKLFDCLENIDCLVRGLDDLPRYSLWPAFIASAEAVDVRLRHRAMSWFSMATKKNIGNIPRAKEVIMATWRKADSKLRDGHHVSRGLSLADWRLVMEDLGPVMIT